MKSQETNVPRMQQPIRTLAATSESVSMEHQREKSGNQQPAQTQNTTAVQPNPVPAAISTFSPVGSLSSNGFRGCTCACACVSVALAEYGMNCYVCQRSACFKFIPSTHTHTTYFHTICGLRTDGAKSGLCRPCQSIPSCKHRPLPSTPCLCICAAVYQE